MTGLYLVVSSPSRLASWFKLWSSRFGILVFPLQCKPLKLSFTLLTPTSESVASVCNFMLTAILSWLALGGGLVYMPETVSYKYFPTIDSPSWSYFSRKFQARLQLKQAWCQFGNCHSAVTIPALSSYLCAHHTNAIGHDLIVFIYWGYSTYFCFAEGEWLKCRHHRLSILPLQSFSSGGSMQYITDPSAYYVFYWVYSYPLLPSR